jgi:hypothetical protein
MTVYKHLMLDIETMGSGHAPAIVSIGAIFFDIETGETGNTFHVYVDLQDSLKHGMKADASTIFWWMNQEPEAREKIQTKGVCLNTALSAFASFVNSAGGNVRIWGNGPSFDCNALSFAFEATGIEKPWKYYNERCVRTMKALDPELAASIPFEGVKHYAIADCFNQIEVVTRIYKKLVKPVKQEITQHYTGFR